MAARDLFGLLKDNRAEAGASVVDTAPRDAPLGGTRAEALQRLQVGVTGLAAMVVVIGVASIIGGQADIAEEAAVPDAAPTTEPTAAPPQRDPLADAGVVPDIPAEPLLEPEEGEDADSPISETAPDGTVIVPDTPPTEPPEPLDLPKSEVEVERS
ncbi:MAG: hypothetical protein AAGB23_00700 [Pseudomonadota bacterium]